MEIKKGVIGPLKELDFVHLRNEMLFIKYKPVATGTVSFIHFYMSVLRDALELCFCNE